MLFGGVFDALAFLPGGSGRSTSGELWLEPFDWMQIFCTNDASRRVGRFSGNHALLHGKHQSCAMYLIPSRFVVSREFENVKK